MNGSAERNIGICWNMIRVRLAGARQPTKMWGEAMNHVDLRRDYLPCYANPDLKSPYEMRTGRKPDVARLHSFGELCYVLAPKSEHRAKLHTRALPCMLIGYENNMGTKAYRVLCVSRNRVYVSRDVRFMGRMFKSDGPTPDVSLLTVDGINAIKTFKPVDQAIANVILAGTLANVDQQDTARLQTFIATIFALAASTVQATALHTPTSYWDMLKCNEKKEQRAVVHLHARGGRCVIFQ